MNKSRLGALQVTLAAMSSVDIPETVRALQYSMRGIEFGDVVLVISCVNACGFEPDALFFAFALPEGTHVGMYVC